MIRDVLQELSDVEEQMPYADGQLLGQLSARRLQLLDACAHLTAEDKVFLSRHAHRPKIGAFISALFTDFFEQRGDRQGKEDPSILGGIALFHGRPVTVIGHRKGANLEENLSYNFGMPEPEGYRKALRLMRQAEKFHRPIITLIDTPGAYPGMEAESHGQGEAIASCLSQMSRLTVPVVTVITGEGNSGGALALSVADRLLMLENAYFAVLTPEGFASILWKDASKRAQACEVMKLTADDLLNFHIIDEIIREPLGGAQRNPQALYRALDEAISRNLRMLCSADGHELAAKRRQRYRQIGRSI